MENRLQKMSAWIALALSGAVLAAENDTQLDSVVVTAPVSSAPLTVTTDPKAPRQPLPAQDGAELLKSIPGFAVVRKGGADGDPVFRGMSGSRLLIVQDGQEILGGCGGRMDPPTAYIYPESYDQVTVLKGPQTVLYGAGNSAAVVLFERDLERMRTPGAVANASLVLGSWGRNDQLLDGKLGNEQFQTRLNATRSDMNDYRDGDGKKVHSAYTRWSGNAAFGWTPDDETLLELAFGRSDGEAAYADRSMDGVKFEREHASLKFERRKLSEVVEKLEASVYYSYIDHVMDNYSLRPQPMMTMVSNPDRKTWGGRFALTLNPAEQWLLTLGADLRDDRHTRRDGSASSWRNQKRMKDYSFERQGLFGEATRLLGDDRRLLAGLRFDAHEVKRHELSPARERKTLTSGFVRFEQDYAGGGSWYAGLGHVERFPDFWEYMRASQGGDGARADDGRSFGDLRPERTTQLDVGSNWRGDGISASLSAFYGKTRDYIQLRWAPQPVAVRNIDATLYGVEADVDWRLAQHWKMIGTFAWVHGRNDRDHRALAQQPPLEARLALEYSDGRFSAGSLLRVVGRQRRVDIGSGSIVAGGMDLGPSSGFATLALNAGWQLNRQALFTIGVDNVFDRSYREHLSQGSAAIAGYEAPLGVPIKEPGRTWWLKAQLALD
ncbi:MAG: TonB-dependent copper receptor [Thauera sp.]|nr:TonB-dependent copper receptor [Thauera sp.]